MKLNRKLFALLCFSLVFCDMAETKSLVYNENIYNKQKCSITNKKIKSMNRILGDTINVANKIVFIYNSFDCETCIDKGYALSKRLDRLRNGQFVYVIATSVNFRRDQLRNNYQNFIFYDEHDIIRKELKYIYTPVIFAFDSDKRIKSVYYPGVESSNEEKKFVYNCLK